MQRRARRAILVSAQIEALVEAPTIDATGSWVAINVRCHIRVYPGINGRATESKVVVSCRWIGKARITKDVERARDDCAPPRSSVRRSPRRRCPTAYQSG